MYRPLIYPQYCHACVEAVEILGCKKVDFVKVGGGEEECPRDCGIQDYCVCVKPTVSHMPRQPAARMKDD